MFKPNATGVVIPLEAKTQVIDLGDTPLTVTTGKPVRGHPEDDHVEVPVKYPHGLIKHHQLFDNQHIDDLLPVIVRTIDVLYDRKVSPSSTVSLEGGEVTFTENTDGK